MKKLMSVDNNEPETLEEILRVNSEPDVTPFLKSEIKQLKKIEVGESLFVGITEIKRVA